MFSYWYWLNVGFVPELDYIVNRKFIDMNYHEIKAQILPNPQYRRYEEACCIDFKQVDNIELDFDRSDYPDFCDTFLESATYKGEPMDDHMIELINEYHSEWLHEQAHERY